MRAGKVSIETLHKCTCANAEMRTRPRLSDRVAMCVVREAPLACKRKISMKMVEVLRAM